MTSKERIFLFGILLITMLLLPLTLKAGTEDEMVQQFLNKHEEVTKRQVMLAPFFTLSYGKVSPDGYHNFTSETNKYIRAINTSDATALSGIYRITSFEGGVSVLINRGQLSFGLDYWLTAGSARTGDFAFYSDLATNAHDDVTDFTLRSEVKVWGAFLEYQYFIHNRPVPGSGLTGLAARFGGGVGYYGAAWHLWDGFGGYIQDTGEWYELTDNLQGSGAGFHLSAGVEYPALKGIVLAADAKYVWLKFDKLSKRVTPTYELYLVRSDTNEPVDMDFTGPRLNLSIKHYFTL
jgi:hypothetical protein